MSLPSYLKTCPEGTLLFVKAQPRASQDAMGEAVGSELKIKIAAPPVDSAANDALVRFLAGVLDCPRGAITIVRGRTSRHKVLLLSGVTPEAAADKLQS